MMHSSKRFKLFVIITIIFLVMSTIILSMIAYNYYEEYNRVQDELVQLAICNNSLQEDLEAKDNEILDLESRLIDIKTKPIYEYTQYSIPLGHNSFRSWMPSSAISTSSKQGQYVRMSTPDKDGLLKINDCYCVALGTYYGRLGDIFKVTTSTGNSFRVIMIDVKADIHTDKNNQYTVSNDCMMEFVVNKNTLNPSIKSQGTVKTEIISGNIIKIEKEIIKQ